ncbi:hypothetical protein AcV5_002209 [Taiwanofungus camphoratus]|nr:hypothetical protein AcV5_002209 [Antrodia cinnamomea]
MSCPTDTSPPSLTHGFVPHWIYESMTVDVPAQFFAPSTSTGPFPDSVVLSTPTSSHLSMSDDEDEDTTLHEADHDRARSHRNHILSSFYPFFDVSCLDALDDQLLLSPIDSFADVCYAQSVCDGDERRPGHVGSHSWETSHSATGTLAAAHGRKDSDDESDSVSDLELGTPTHTHGVPKWGEEIASQGFSEIEETKHVRFAQLSPAVKSETTVRSRVFCDPDTEIAFLFSSAPPDPTQSVHFFPMWSEEPRPERSLLRASTNVLMRSLAGLRAGLHR